MSKIVEQKYLIGTVAVLSMLIAGTLGVVLSPDKIYYKCESKDVISDCVNGVKADGLRCYYDENNGRKYEYCAEGWVEYKEVLEEIPKNPIRETSYICTIDRCEV